LDPPWRVRKIQARHTPHTFQPRRLYVGGYTNPTRVSKLSKLPRFEACGAWERSYNPRYVSRMVMVPKPKCNRWRLIIDLRELNRYCSTFKTDLRNPQAPPSPLPPGRLFCLPRPHRRVLHPRHPRRGPRLLHGQLPRHPLARRLPSDGLVRLSVLLLQTYTGLYKPPASAPAAYRNIYTGSRARRNIFSGRPDGAVRDSSPTWTISFSCPTRTTTRCSLANASKPYSTA
jgi:hypothetical protein